MSTTAEESGSELEALGLKRRSKLQNLEKRELLAYVQKLHEIIINKSRQLKKAQQPSVECKQSPKDDDATTKAIEETIEQEQQKEEETDAANGETKAELSAADAFSFVDEMRQAAQQAQVMSNFIYEPTSGLYFDPGSGYYYNAEYGLYYDGNTGQYLNFNETKKTYEFHSQPSISKKTGGSDDDLMQDVEFDENGGVITDKVTLARIRADKERAQRQKYEARTKKKKEVKSGKKRRHSSSRSEDGGSLEDGELSDSSSQTSTESSSVPVFKSFEDIAKKYPPSLRIVIQETTIEKLKVGSLSMITFKGGSLGREGEHDVILPDANVSKDHLRFEYDHKACAYRCTDLGSRNGTVLNGLRMSSAKVPSKAHELQHGSIIEIGQTKLLCHIHEGNSTCGLCEPGLLIEKTPPRDGAATAVPLTHKAQLKKLQKKYGLENEKFIESKPTASNYNDRAEKRRIHVGSSNEHEKTEVASVDTAISSENKGFKMLSKLGWNKGESLGASGAGLLEPVNVVSNEGTVGLGCTDMPSTSSTSLASKKKLASLKITQERYKKADIFNVSDESD